MPSFRAERDKFLVGIRAASADSVPELHRRLLQRREVVTTLTKWTDGVLSRG